MKPRPQGNALFVILGQNNLEHTFENLTKLLKILEGNNQLFIYLLYLIALKILIMHKFLKVLSLYLPVAC
jgi:hypothetical protein